jgi:flagellar basal body-associated protein FliL
MAEKTPTNPADGSAPGAGGAGLSSKTGRKMPLMPIILAVVVVGVGGGAGMVVGRMAQGGGGAKGGASERVGSQEKASYFDLEPIIVNLDEPRLARYVRVSVTLVASSENAKAVTEALEKKKPELKNWLTVYLAGRTLEQVRGANNLNQIRREVQDAFNRHLWPDHAGLIDHILLKEFAVQ